MGTAEMAPTRFTCHISDCVMKFASQRELHDHEEQLHGEQRHPLEAGSGSSIASSSDEVKSSAMKQPVENGKKLTESFFLLFS